MHAGHYGGELPGRRPTETPRTIRAKAVISGATSAGRRTGAENAADRGLTNAEGKPGGARHKHRCKGAGGEHQEIRYLVAVYHMANFRRHARPARRGQGSARRSGSVVNIEGPRKVSRRARLGKTRIFATTGIVRDGKEQPARFHRKGVVGSL